MTNSAPGAGQPAPWFIGRSPTNERFVFHTLAGRYIVLSFFGSAAAPTSASLLRNIVAHRQAFDDVQASFFGVSIDPQDEQLKRVQNLMPGIRFFWDFDRRVSALYGAALPGGGYAPVSYLLDPALRVVAALPIVDDTASHIAELLDILASLPKVEPVHRAAPQAPVLVVTRVFEPELCRLLIDHYDTHGGEESGFMREENGKTITVMDYGHKRRRDQTIDDEKLVQTCMNRVHARLVPEVFKAFQFSATRMERSIVACYDAEEGGHFRPHRDNTTKGTAHRRFAVSVFLNSGQYEGGMLRFPEFGLAEYSAPLGGAVVFSCSLLHEATPVTHGRRYMFLPFLYDEAARRVREENLRFVNLPAGKAAGHAKRQEGTLRAQPEPSND